MLLCMCHGLRDLSEGLVFHEGLLAVLFILWPSRIRRIIKSYNDHYLLVPLVGLYTKFLWHSVLLCELDNCHGAEWGSIWSGYVVV